MSCSIIVARHAVARVHMFILVWLSLTLLLMVAAMLATPFPLPIIDVYDYHENVCVC